MISGKTALVAVALSFNVAALVLYIVVWFEK